MIFHTIPDAFNPRFEIVSCYVEHDGKILLLHRHDHKSQGGKWGLPAGKMEAGETKIEAMARELREETGLILETRQAVYLGRVFVRYPDHDFVYHMFQYPLSGSTPVRINDQEHKDHQWISPYEASRLPLVDDLEECMKLYYV